MTKSQPPQPDNQGVTPKHLQNLGNLPNTKQPDELQPIHEELIRAFLQYQAEMATKYEQAVLVTDSEFWSDKIVKDILAKLRSYIEQEIIGEDDDPGSRYHALVEYPPMDTETKLWYKYRNELRELQRRRAGIGEK